MQLLDGPHRAAREQLLMRGLTAALLQELDEDQDGEVTRVEWLKGMLVALDEVDPELIDIILTQFDNLDTDKSGTLDMEDIRASTDLLQSRSLSSAVSASPFESTALHDTVTSGGLEAALLDSNDTFQRRLSEFADTHDHNRGSSVNVGVFHF